MRRIPRPAPTVPTDTEPRRRLLALALLVDKHDGPRAPRVMALREALLGVSGPDTEWIGRAYGRLRVEGFVDRGVDIVLEHTRGGEAA